MAGFTGSLGLEGPESFLAGNLLFPRRSLQIESPQGSRTLRALRSPEEIPPVDAPTFDSSKNRTRPASQKVLQGSLAFAFLAISRLAFLATPYFLAFFFATFFFAFFFAGIVLSPSVRA
jgi:hypothetical protein